MKMIKRLLGLAASAALALTMVALPASAALDTTGSFNLVIGSGGDAVKGPTVSLSGVSTTQDPAGKYSTAALALDATTNYNVNISGVITGIGGASAVNIPIDNYTYPATALGSTLTGSGASISLNAKNNMVLSAKINFNSAVEGISKVEATPHGTDGTASSGSAITMSNSGGDGSSATYTANVTGGIPYKITVTGSKGTVITNGNFFFGGQTADIPLSSSGGGGGGVTPGYGNLNVTLNGRVNTTYAETATVTLSGNGQTRSATAYFGAGVSSATANFTSIPTGTYTISSTYGGYTYSGTAYVNSNTSMNYAILNGAGTNANSLTVTVYNNSNNNTTVGAGYLVELRSGSTSGTVVKTASTDSYGKVTFNSDGLATGVNYYATSSVSNNNYYSNYSYLNASRNFSPSAISIGNNNYNGTSTSATMSGTGYRNSSSTYSGTANISLTTNSNPVTGTWDIRLTNSSTSATSYNVGSGSVYVNNNTSSYTYSTSISVSTSNATVYMWYKAPTSSDYSYGGSFSMSGSYYNNIPEDNIFNNNASTSGTPAAAASSINRNSTAKLGKYSGVTFTATNSGSSVTSSDVQDALGVIDSVSYNSADLPTSARSAISRLLNANTTASVNSPATARPLFFTDDTTGGTKFPFNLIVSMPVTESMADGNPTLFRYKNGAIQKMTTEVRVSGTTASFAINDTSVYFLATGITSVDLAAGEGTVDSNEDITVDETTAAEEETMAPVVTDAPVVMETTAAAVNPSTGNAPIALVIIPVALAAACVIAKRTK